MKRPRASRPTAFQAGCDARYAAKPLAACPYAGEHEAREWRAGWLAVDAALLRVAAAGRGGAA